jgi:hypothetical protein
MKRLRDLWAENRRLVLITFEVFWIIVFLLDHLGKGAAGGVPGFVYVNF